MKLFFKGTRWRGLNGSIFGGEFEVFRDSNYKFYFMTLFDFLFPCRLEDIVSLVIFIHVFSLFNLLKAFSIVLYFVNSLFIKLENCIEVKTTYYFSFTLKLNEKEVCGGERLQ